MGRLDHRFWSLTVIFIIVVILIILIWITKGTKQPKVCDEPAKPLLVRAFYNLTEGTTIFWDCMENETIFKVFIGDCNVSYSNFDKVIITTDKFLKIPRLKMSKHFVICPENECGFGPCSEIVKSELVEM